MVLLVTGECPLLRKPEFYWWRLNYKSRSWLPLKIVGISVAINGNMLELNHIKSIA